MNNLMKSTAYRCIGTTLPALADPEGSDPGGVEPARKANHDGLRDLAGV